MEPQQHNAAQWVEDMITLQDLTEETLLHNLRLRYQDDLIYVRVKE